MERKIVRDVSKNPHLIAKTIINYVKLEGLNVLKKTITKCLHVEGLSSKKNFLAYD